MHRSGSESSFGSHEGPGHWWLLWGESSHEQSSLQQTRHTELVRRTSERLQLSMPELQLHWHPSPA